MYSDSEDTNAVMAIAREIIARSRARPAVSVQPNAQPSPENGDSVTSGPTDRRTELHKVAYNIAMRLRQDRSKFTGDIGE